MATPRHIPRGKEVPMYAMLVGAGVFVLFVFALVLLML